MDKYSPWFPPEIKPVHEGVYQIAFWGKNNPSYSKWQKGTWRYSWSPLSDLTFKAALQANNLCSIQIVEWRGLARKPK